MVIGLAVEGGVATLPRLTDRGPDDRGNAATDLCWRFHHQRGRYRHKNGVDTSSLLRMPCSPPSGREAQLRLSLAQRPEGDAGDIVGGRLTVNATEHLSAMPEWTELRQKSGLDPLGMQAASVNLYQRLVPGISNVTLRIRYYGLYAWLCRTYAERIGDTSPETWKRTVRRAEALLALVAVNADDEDGNGGVAGVLWAGRRLGEHASGPIDFRPDTDPGGAGTPYLKQAWGAYGAAYASQLYEAGVFGEADQHAIPVPAPGLGDVLANGFAEAIGPLADVFFALAQDGRVTKTDLASLTPVLPSGIGDNTAERDAYQRLLFAAFEDPRPNDIARQRSLRLALHLMGVIDEQASADVLRWACYGGASPNGQPITDLGDELETHRQRWWAYQAGDLGRIACEALLKWLLDTVEGHTTGIEPARAVAEAVDALATVGAGWPRTWRQLVAALPLAENPQSRSEQTSERALSKVVLGAGRGEQRADVASARAAIELLAVLHRRCAPSRALLASGLGGEGIDGAAFRSLASELAFLDAQQDAPLDQTLVRVMRERVLDRHLWVAMQKLRHQGDYTFLVEADDGRIRVRAKDGPVLTNPRLDNALTFLRDIHLLGPIGLTERGRELVETT